MSSTQTFTFITIIGLTVNPSKVRAQETEILFLSYRLYSGFSLTGAFLLTHSSVYLLNEIINHLAYEYQVTQERLKNEGIDVVVDNFDQFGQAGEMSLYI